LFKRRINREGVRVRCREAFQRTDGGVVERWREVEVVEM
jgi:hypothetical protein